MAIRMAIIGSGSVGRALGKAFGKAGHEIVYGVRDPQDQKHQDLAPASVTTGLDAASVCEVIILALPWKGIESSLQSLGDIAGKIVIDCTNPLVWDGHGLVLAKGFDTSGAETIAALVPGARVVKTLNQVGAEVMADTSGFAPPPLMFMAGDDDAAKQVVSGLLHDIGFEPLDAGDLTKARLLEPFALVWINQAISRGKGRDWAFAALPRR